MSALLTLMSYRRPHLGQVNDTVDGSIFISRLTRGVQCRIFLLLRLPIMDIFRVVVHEVIDPSSARLGAPYARSGKIPTGSVRHVA